MMMPDRRGGPLVELLVPGQVRPVEVDALVELGVERAEVTDLVVDRHQVQSGVRVLRESFT
jgi:hypothetical protein